MLLLGLDLETGGEFNASNDRNFIIEIGMVMWDTEFGQPVEIYSVLIDNERPISSDAAEYTGITDALVKRHGSKPDIRVIHPVKDLMEKADFIVAHNGRDFDRPLMEAFFIQKSHRMPSKPWIDTLYDVD